MGFHGVGRPYPPWSACAGTRAHFLNRTNNKQLSKAITAKPIKQHKHKHTTKHTNATNQMTQSTKMHTTYLLNRTGARDSDLGAPPQRPDRESQGRRAERRARAAGGGRLAWQAWPQGQECRRWRRRRQCRSGGSGRDAGKDAPAAILSRLLRAGDPKGFSKASRGRPCAGGGRRWGRRCGHGPAREPRQQQQQQQQQQCRPGPSPGSGPGPGRRQRRARRGEAGEGCRRRRAGGARRRPRGDGEGHPPGGSMDRNSRCRAGRQRRRDGRRRRPLHVPGARGDRRLGGLLAGTRRGHRPGLPGDLQAEVVQRGPVPRLGLLGLLPPRLPGCRAPPRLHAGPAVGQKSPAGHLLLHVEHRWALDEGWLGRVAPRGDPRRSEVSPVLEAVLRRGLARAGESRAEGGWKGAPRAGNLARLPQVRRSGAAGCDHLSG